jgi:rhodanese-related sulfurtransferase
MRIQRLVFFGALSLLLATTAVRASSEPESDPTAAYPITPLPPKPAAGSAATAPAKPDSAKPAAPAAAAPAAPGAPDPVKAKLAAKLERKLRTEYLKATMGVKGPVIKPDILLSILEDTNLVLLDIRQPEEQAVSMIPHAMTTQQFADRFRKGLPKSKRIVVYCTIGFRSGKYAMELAGQRIQAENLEGGLLAWSHIGGPLEVRNAAGMATPTRRVHIYSSGWNFLHPDYEAVW